MEPNKLFVYACSFGKYGTVLGPNAHIWTDEKSFGHFISKEKKLELVNYSEPGASNQLIFKRYLDTVDEIKENDITIVQWSHICRYTSMDNLTIMAHSVNSPDKELAKLANSYYKYFYDELLNFSQIVGLSRYIKENTRGKIYISCVEDPQVLLNVNKRLYETSGFVAFDGKGIHGYLSSFKNSKVYYECAHPEELGHKYIAESYLKVME